MLTLVPCSFEWNEFPPTLQLLNKHALLKITLFLLHLGK